jgi:hypothetical protein
MSNRDPYSDLFAVGLQSDFLVCVDAVIPTNRNSRGAAFHVATTCVQSQGASPLGFDLAKAPSFKQRCALQPGGLP